MSAGVPTPSRDLLVRLADDEMGDEAKRVLLGQHVPATRSDRETVAREFDDLVLRCRGGVSYELVAHLCVSHGWSYMDGVEVVAESLRRYRARARR